MEQIEVTQADRDAALEIVRGIDRTSRAYTDFIAEVIARHRQHSLPDRNSELRNAALDALSGWRYIRRAHGDLHGVGWDRVEHALDTTLAEGSKPCPPFHFTRYVNGVEMAEGVTIEKERTLEGAMQRAAQLAPKAPGTVLVLNTRTPPNTEAEGLAERVQLELAQTKEWEPRLKQLLTGILAALTSPPEVEAMDWFSGQTRLSLEHYSPTYGDDDDQAREWRVHRESGSINDREWEIVGRGDTALEAVITAMKGDAS